MLAIRLIGLGVLLFLVSCVSSQPSLKVVQDRISQEHLKSQDKMVAFSSESELNKHIHPRDRDAAQGEYFTFLFKNLAVDENADVQLTFYYRTAKSKAKVLKEVWNIDVEAKSFKFAYTNDWIEGKGEMLSWKAQLKSGAQVLAEQQSYLWKNSY